MNFKLEDVPQFYQNYIQKVGNAELVPSLLSSGDQFVETCKKMSDNQALYRYAEGKWSVKDMIQHMIDSERIFVYRVLRFARNDSTELSGFEQDDYVPEANADARPLHQLLSEFTNLRASTIDLFSSLGEKERARTGFSNKVEMSVEMLGYIIVGHTIHHHTILKERYIK